jgi:hypothetical protein
MMLSIPIDASGSIFLKKTGFFETFHLDDWLSFFLFFLLKKFMGEA